MTLTSRSPVDGQLCRRTYVTCLNCGEELAYNWNKMKIEGRSFRETARPAVVAAMPTGVCPSMLPVESRRNTTGTEAGSRWTI